MNSLVSSILLASGALIFLLDLFFHGVCDLIFTTDITTKIFVQIIFLFSYLLYIAFNLKNIKKVVLSTLVFSPVLVMNRDLLEIKTYSFVISIFDIALVTTSAIAIFCNRKSKQYEYIDPLSLVFIAFILAGFFTLAAQETTIGLLYIYSAFLIPLIYLNAALHMGVSKEDAIKAAAGTILVSILIFLLQNIYIGPLTVLQSSRNQTWLIDAVSIANGGFIEMGTMQTILIPISFYIIFNSIYAKAIFKKNSYLFIKICAWFVMAMPFVYNNRANSALVIFLFLFFIFKTYSKKKIISFIPFFLPLFGCLIYAVVTGRSFAEDGASINFFGVEISGINSTTYDHLYATTTGFDALAKNLVFGVGSFVGPRTWEDSFFAIGNYRNLIFPAIEIAIGNGLIFFAIYLFFVFFMFNRASEQLIKLYILLPFIPILGASKFFGLYATGSIDFSRGFVSLSDHPPVAVFSLGMVLIYLIGIAKENGKNPH